MGIDLAMKEALDDRADAVALACMDTRSGLVLGLQVRGDVGRDDVELAALAAADVCTLPSLDVGCEGWPEESDEAFVASNQYVHAFARVPRRRELVVVGLAKADANVALLRAWLRAVAERVDSQP